MKKNPLSANIQKIANKIILIILILNLIYSIISPFLTIISIYIFFNLSNSTILEGNLIVNSSETTYIESILLLIPILIFYICYIFISYQIYKFFHSISIGKYFEYKNGIRLRNIGFTFIIGSLLFAISTYLTRTIMVSLYEDMQSLEQPDLLMYALSGAVVGFMFIAVSQAFIQGSKIEEENKLTV